MPWRGENERVRKLLLDTDIGSDVDDAVALGLIFGTPGLDLLGVSTVYGDTVLRGGDRITIDGSDGSVYLGALPLSQPHIGGALGELLGWSDSTRRIEVRTNAETIDAAKTALSFGADSVRTE